MVDSYYWLYLFRIEWYLPSKIDSRGGYHWMGVRVSDLMMTIICPWAYGVFSRLNAYYKRLIPSYPFSVNLFIESGSILGGIFFLFVDKPYT